MMQKDKLGQDMFLIGSVAHDLTSCACFDSTLISPLVEMTDLRDHRDGGSPSATARVCSHIPCPMPAGCRPLTKLSCAVTRREAEYVALSADTTEGDLKQRREIINGTVQHLDQPPVIAATQGRILILEGVISLALINQQGPRVIPVP